MNTMGAKSLNVFVQTWYNCLVHVEDEPTEFQGRRSMVDIRQMKLHRD